MISSNLIRLQSQTYLSCNIIYCDIPVGRFREYKKKPISMYETDNYYKLYTCMFIVTSLLLNCEQRNKQY